MRMDSRASQIDSLISEHVRVEFDENSIEPTSSHSFHHFLLNCFGIIDDGFELRVPSVSFDPPFSTESILLHEIHSLKACLSTLYYLSDDIHSSQNSVGDGLKKKVLLSLCI